MGQTLILGSFPTRFRLVNVTTAISGNHTTRCNTGLLTVVGSRIKNLIPRCSTAWSVYKTQSIATNWVNQLGHNNRLTLGTILNIHL